MVGNPTNPEGIIPGNNSGAEADLPNTSTGEELISRTAAVTDLTVIVLTGGNSRRFGRDKATERIAGASMLNHVLAGIPPDIPVVVVGPTPQDISRPVLVTREDPPGGGPVAGIIAGLEFVSSPVCCVIATDMPAASSTVVRLGRDLRQWQTAASEQARSQMRTSKPQSFETGKPPTPDQYLGVQAITFAHDSDSSASDSPATVPTSTSSVSTPASLIPEALIPMDGNGKRQPLCAAYVTEALQEAGAELRSGQGASMRDLLAELQAHEVRLPAADESQLFDIDTQADLVTAQQAIMASNGGNRRLPQPGWTKMLNDFTAAAAKELDLETELNVEIILDVAKDVAHGVERPAAPLSTYLLGYAVAKGASLEQAAAQLRDLANQWPGDPA
jgi:molybdopterin-guanine dinucleotide biosynthesis protein A